MGNFFLSHEKYAKKVLLRFLINMCKPMETPFARNWRKEDAALGEVVDPTIYR